MSAYFDGKSKIVGLQLGELIVHNVGPSRGMSAKLAFVTAEGQTAGMFVLRTVSERSEALLAQLVSSIEADGVRLLSDPRDAAALEEASDEDFDFSQ
jgi:hypothetical protein